MYKKFEDFLVGDKYSNPEANVSRFKDFNPNEFRKGSNEYGEIFNQFKEYILALKLKNPSQNTYSININDIPNIDKSLLTKMINDPKQNVIKNISIDGEIITYKIADKEDIPVHMRRNEDVMLDDESEDYIKNKDLINKCIETSTFKPFLFINKEYIKNYVNNNWFHYSPSKIKKLLIFFKEHDIEVDSDIINRMYNHLETLFKSLEIMPEKPEYFPYWYKEEKGFLGMNKKHIYIYGYGKKDILAVTYEFSIFKDFDELTPIIFKHLIYNVGNEYLKGVDKMPLPKIFFDFNYRGIKNATHEREKDYNKLHTKYKKQL